MSKYEKALNNVRKFEREHNMSKFGDVVPQPNSDTLQELVDKETPMKVDKKDIKKIHCDKYLIPLVTYYKCPNEKCELHNNYKILVDEKRCPECGQKLYWGDECE